MMKRTPDQLVATLERALAWRKKELTDLKFTVSLAPEARQRMLLRAAVCLLYAHWEGFIKDAATEYIRYVASQGLLLEDVTINFVALGFHSNIVTAGSPHRPTSHTALINTILNEQHQPFTPQWREVVDARSNLDSKHLAEILCQVGVNPANYLSKGHLLDERLLKNRNAIAHGQGNPIEVDEYDELHEVVVALLDQFRDDLEQAAVSLSYLRSQRTGH